MIIFDEFTGFTPIQNQLLRKLLTLAERICVSVTMDAGEDFYHCRGEQELFAMSKKTVSVLLKMAEELHVEVKEPIVLSDGKKHRYKNAPSLYFMEQNLFRYHRGAYNEEQKEVQIFQAGNPEREMEETARRISRLVREHGYRYGQIAVITGNLEEYGSIARHVFDAAEIPFFVDEKHSVLMNPFVEYLRAVLEMTVQGFSYESVFRYLRCGMSDLSRREVDILENYVIALGIRGFRKWNETWVRIYRGMDPAVIMDLNEIREHFTEEVRELAEGFSGKKKTVGEYSIYLYDFIVKRQIQEKLKVQELHFKQQGDRAREKEYAQIYGIIMDLLDKMVSILGEEVVSPEEFRQLLETGMTQAKVALIPPGIDQVLIGDMERTRLKDIRALFFVGVNEGCIPKNTESGGILTEMDRDFLGNQGIELAPGPKELMNMQRFYL